MAENLEVINGLAQEEVVQNDPNYDQYNVAQNHAGRMVTIRKIRNDINRENKKTINNSILCGIFFVGTLACMKLGGIDIEQAFKVELDVLTSFDAFKTYLMQYTNPGSLISFSAMLKTLNLAKKHRENAQIGRENLEAYIENNPAQYMEYVEEQARIR